MTYVNIDTELSAEYQDVPPWRSYHLTAEGSSLTELLESATIAEVDQDGGDLRYYGLVNAPNAVIQEAEQVIAQRWTTVTLPESY